ncbi:unnamed protein product [Adineta ricciae]|uniref:Fizzy-related protein homolog n=1 Tax=Adineta ricciae TaxID=249248 RepID=A0A815ZAP5_ADIRI|nr:unnamed protein product [Adineta ricciae]CAF1582487.1 unnamed protein product [Adineta ricciae]
MEPDFERRLIRSMSGCSSLSSSPFSSSTSSPSPIKCSDRFVPLRSLAQPSAFFVDQEQTYKGPMTDKKTSRDLSSSITTTTTNASGNFSNHVTTSAADRTKDILTYQTLLQNEMFGTQIDTLYDDYYTNNSYNNTSNVHLHATASSNTILDPMNSGTINVQLNTTAGNGQTHTTSISGLNGILTQSFQQRLPYTNTNSNLLRTRDPNTIFRYSARRNADDLHYSPYSLSLLSPASTRLLRSPRKQLRKIPKTPFKVLDAPELQDDFYLNLVDWSSTNILAVGLNASVYLWNANTSNVTRLCDLQTESDTVTSVAWSDRGQYVAVGTHKGIVQIWDAQTNRKTASFPRHTARVGALAWNDHCIYSGSRDRFILQNDTRSNKQERKLAGHRQEVCGLKWSPDRQLLASGGNDNRLLVWNQSCINPIQIYTDHTAAVKAIAWSPHQQGLLASGGGTADRYIRFWNTLTAQSLQCIDTGSQVCNLAWSKHSNELVSTHGYSQNQIVVWKYPSMLQLARLTGHTFRVLYLAVSPDGESIVTGAGDETLRFWNVFTKCRANKESDSVLNLFNKIR